MSQPNLLLWPSLQLALFITAFSHWSQNHLRLWPVSDTSLLYISAVIDRHSIHFQVGYQSTHHTVISSHGHVVTRSIRHWSTRHRRVFSQSQLVTQSSRHTVISSQASCENDLHRQNARPTRHTVESSQSQLVTTPKYTTVNSSHDFRWFLGVTRWPCDELTGSLQVLDLWQRSHRNVLVSSVVIIPQPEYEDIVLEW